MDRGTLLIWGAGAIGGTVGAYWKRAGHDLLFVDRDAEHVGAINTTELRITGPIEEFTVKAPALLPQHVKGKFDTVFLCVKAPDTAAATGALAPFVADDGCVVSLQNGLNERVIAAKLGAQRTIGAFINFGADYLSPGVVHYAGRGAVVIGELDGKRTPRIEALHRLMREFDDRAVLTPNIWGYLWGKLAYGALLFATALTNDSIACLAAPEYRAVFIALAREVEGVAVASGVKLESFDGFDPAAFMPEAPLSAAEQSLDEQVVHNRKSAKTHTGIWRDLAVRKRKTEVDAQLGPIVEAGAAKGIPTPLTQRTIALIHDIEEGRRPLAWETLDELGKGDAGMNISFAGRRAIVTGARHGFGRAIAKAFAENGAQVFACDAVEEGLAETRKLCGASCETAIVDVSDRDAVHAYVAKIAGGRPIDILVNNAGGVLGQVGRPMEEISPADWQKIFDVNVTGAFNCAQAVVPGMKQAKRGRIVNISSGAGLGISLTGIQAYASAKAAQIGLTRQLAHELGPWNITVNNVAPGFVRSNPTTERQWEAYGAEGQKRLVESIALKRLGAPEDIANGVLFFASDQAAWITGQVLSIDGGK